VIPLAHPLPADACEDPWSPRDRTHDERLEIAVKLLRERRVVDRLDG
jgi:hypothetical protein